MLVDVYKGIKAGREGGSLYGTGLYISLTFKVFSTSCTFYMMVEIRYDRFQIALLKFLGNKIESTRMDHLQMADGPVELVHSLLYYGAGRNIDRDNNSLWLAQHIRVIYSRC